MGKLGTTNRINSAEYNSQFTSPNPFPSLCSKKQNQTMNKYNATITQINAKIFTWKTQCGKNHETVVHLKTSTITNNGFTIVLPQIQLRATTYISSRTTYSRITTRLKRVMLEKSSQHWQPRFLSKRPASTPLIFNPTVQNEA